jgi:hypothetical protein
MIGFVAADLEFAIVALGLEDLHSRVFEFAKQFFIGDGQGNTEPLAAHGALILHAAVADASKPGTGNRRQAAGYFGGGHIGLANSYKQMLARSTRHKAEFFVDSKIGAVLFNNGAKLGSLIGVMQRIEVSETPLVNVLRRLCFIPEASSRLLVDPSAL